MKNNVLTVKVYYKKNLKLSPAKLASQVAHAVNGLMLNTTNLKIQVLMASNKKFEEIKVQRFERFYIQKDWGLTEVTEGTETCIAYIESNNE